MLRLACGGMAGEARGAIRPVFSRFMFALQMDGGSRAERDARLFCIAPRMYVGVWRTVRYVRDMELDNSIRYARLITDS